MDGSDAVVMQPDEKPTEAKERKAWEAKDKSSKTYIWLRLSPELRPLAAEHSSGSSLWTALKSKFETSTMARRITARQSFYTCPHDPSLPVDVYIQQLSQFRRQLIAMGQKVEDQEFTDVLLMNLDSSFDALKTTILAQPTEPSLDTIKAILTKTTPSSDASISIKQESVFAARSKSGNIGRVDTGKRSGRSPGRRDFGVEYPVDDKGFRWCDPTTDRACHRCGRRGHVASTCIADMPQNVKDWVISLSRSNSPPRSGPPHLHSAQSATSYPHYRDVSDDDQDTHSAPVGPMLI